jgi:hypothetical protein
MTREGRAVALLDDCDAWGEPLRMRGQLESDPFGFVVWSCGPDQHDDGGEGDDIGPDDDTADNAPGKPH